MRAIDLAGNRSRQTRRVPVVVRFVALGRDRVEVAPGGRFAIGVSTDVPRYRWRFGGRTAVASGPLLRLTAPEEPGTYTLVRAHARRPCRQRRGGGAGRPVSAPLLVLGVRRSGTHAAACDPRPLAASWRSRTSRTSCPSSRTGILAPSIPRPSSTTCAGCRGCGELGISPDDVARRLTDGMTTGAAIARGLRDVRRRARQTTLGRQDAPLHAASAARSNGSSRRPGSSISCGTGATPPCRSWPCRRAS